MILVATQGRGHMEGGKAVTHEQRFKKKPESWMPRHWRVGSGAVLAGSSPFFQAELTTTAAEEV